MTKVETDAKEVLEKTQTLQAKVQAFQNEMKADQDAMWDGIKIGLIIVTEIAVIVIPLSFCPLACMPECFVIALVVLALGGFGAAHLISGKGKHGR
jgi:hypothetical protein